MTKAGPRQEKEEEEARGDGFSQEGLLERGDGLREEEVKEGESSWTGCHNGSRTLALMV